MSAHRIFAVEPNGLRCTLYGEDLQVECAIVAKHSPDSIY